MKTLQLDRRSFRSSAALAGAGFWLGGCATMQAIGAPEAAPLIRKRYRQGFELPVHS